MVNIIKKEIISVVDENCKLTERGITFINYLVESNEEIFLDIFKTFDKTRRNVIYNLILERNLSIIKYINKIPSICKPIIEKTLIKLLNKGIYDTRNIKVSELSINTNKLDKNYRVLFLSDLQIKNLIQGSYEINNVIKEQNADILILGGDIVDCSEDLVKLEGYLNDLNIKYKYYVRGNHEYTLSKSELLEYKEILNKLGFVDINNKNVFLGGLNIIGVDDVLSKKDDLKRAYRGLNKGFNLVVTHNHDINYKLDKLNLQSDLVLSGHTHGGQIVIPFNKVDKITRLWKEKGLYKGEYFFKGKNKKYRNYTVNGLGGSLTPLRLNAQQEILLLNIKRC